MNTVNNDIPFVPENTLDPAAGLNLAINKIDSLLQLAVISVNLNTPPVSPADGDRYIVGPTPTGVWTGQGNKLARYIATGDFWQFSDAYFAFNLADGLIHRFSGGAWVTGESTTISDDMIIVRTLADLPSPVANEITLPANKTILITGLIDLGANALRLSTDTVLRGFGGDSVMSSATGGVVRATNVGSAVVIREANVIATAGPCLALEGTTAHQLNLFFVGLIGPSAGTVTGFDVQAFKDTFFATADGVTLAGTTNKVFISQSPFYTVAAGNAAVTLDATLNARRMDVVEPFFKHDPAGIPIRAEVGYQVGYGRVNGLMLDGPTTPLEGLTSADPNWWFKGCDGIADSRVASQAYLTAADTTLITQVGEFVQVAGAFALSPRSQRMSLNANNELVNDSNQPVLLSFMTTLTVDPSSNDRLEFRVTENGVTIPESRFIVEQGAGAGASPRPGWVSSLVYLNPGESAGLAVANLTTIANVPWLSCTFVVA